MSSAVTATAATSEMSAPSTAREVPTATAGESARGESAPTAAGKTALGRPASAAAE